MWLVSGSMRRCDRAGLSANQDHLNDRPTARGARRRAGGYDPAMGHALRWIFVRGSAIVFMLPYLMIDARRVKPAAIRRFAAWRQQRQPEPFNICGIQRSVGPPWHGLMPTR